MNGPTKYPQTIKYIIVITSLTFLIQIVLDQWFQFPLLESLGALILHSPQGVPWWHIWRLFSYGLLHYDIYHLFLNMLGLWLIGPTVEELLGRRSVITIYIACIVGGGISALIFANLFPKDVAMISTLMGASAGTLGILATYIALYPHSTMQIWLLVLIPIKAKILGAILLLWQIFGLLSQNSSTISYGAHIGGILVGFLCATAISKGWWKRWQSAFSYCYKRYKRRHLSLVVSNNNIQSSSPDKQKSPNIISLPHQK